MFIKYLAYAGILILAVLLTFFGMGPVLLADGSFTERMVTLLIVLAGYILLAAIFVFIMKRNKEHLPRK